MSGAHQSPAGREAQRQRALAQWADPEYRAKHVERLRKQSVEYRAKAWEASRAKRQLPDRRSPEGHYYEKLRRALGVAAAREALGIGQ